MSELDTTASDPAALSVAEQPAQPQDRHAGLSDEQLLAIMQAIQDQPNQPKKSELEKIKSAMVTGLADSILGSGIQSGHAIRTMLFNLLMEYRALGVFLDLRMQRNTAACDPVELMQRLLPTKIAVDDKVLEVLDTMLRLQQPVVPTIRAHQLNVGLQQVNMSSQSVDGMSKSRKSTPTSGHSE